MAEYKGKQLNLIQIGDVPQSEMTTSDVLYHEGRRSANGSQNLEEAAIHTIPINDELGIYVMSKRNPYVASPGLDCMLYVAKEEGCVRSILELDAPTFATVLKAAVAVLQHQSRVAEVGVGKQIISINYHDNPILDIDVFGKKVHAQSLMDLHLHAFTLTEDELANIRDVNVADISQSLKDYMVDPFLPIIDRFMINPEVLNFLLSGTSAFSLEDSAFEGISLRVQSEIIGTPLLANNLQQLISNYHELFGIISDIFVNDQSIDTKSMPIPRPYEEVQSRLSEFSERFLPSDPVLQRCLYRVGKLLKKSDIITTASERIFLRGLAYTLSIITEIGESGAIVRLSPRVISTGNALTALGLFYQKLPIVDSNWLELRAIRETALHKFLSEEEI